MDTRTGEIMPREEMEKRLRYFPEDKPYYKLVPNQPTRNKTGKHEPCPCGSGKKFLKCCMNPTYTKKKGKNMVKYIYEDELPESMTDEEYDEWYKNSWIDFVRMGFTPQMKCPECGEKTVIMDKQPGPPQSYVCPECGRVRSIFKI